MNTIPTATEAMLRLMDKKKAYRNSKAPRFDLIPSRALAKIAGAFEKGSKRYGEDNWQHGDEAYARDCLNHAIAHLLKYAEGDRTEKHLAHACANLIMIMELTDEFKNRRNQTRRFEASNV